MRSTLVASQAALTVVLVAGAFYMGRTFLRVIGTDLGYRADHLVTLNVSLAGTRYAAGGLETQYYGEAIGAPAHAAGLSRLRRSPTYL